MEDQKQKCVPQKVDEMDNLQKISGFAGLGGVATETIAAGFTDNTKVQSGVGFVGAFGAGALVGTSIFPGIGTIIGGVVVLTSYGIFKIKESSKPS